MFTQEMRKGDKCALTDSKQQTDPATNSEKKYMMAYNQTTIFEIKYCRLLNNSPLIQHINSLT